MEDEDKIEDIAEITDSQTLAEIQLFFNMAMDLENTKFNLYPRQCEEMQLKCIELVLKRLEFFEYE